jgi:DNA-binding NarL/FixJ family response regulator
MLRVVLADDNFLVREGVAALLGEAPGIEVVASVGDAGELLEIVGRLRPDAVLTDIRMPPSFTTEPHDRCPHRQEDPPGDGLAARPHGGVLRAGTCLRWGVVAVAQLLDSDPAA